MGDSIGNVVPPLPFEMISEILEMAVVKDTDAMFSTLSMTTPISELADIASILQVNNDFNTIAKRNRRIWASALRPSLDSKARTELISELAGTCPLTISSNIIKFTPRSFALAGWPVVLEKIPNFQHFHIEISSFVDKSLLATALTLRAPKLQSLRIHDADEPNMMDEEDEDSDIEHYYLEDASSVQSSGPHSTNGYPILILPDKLFSGEAPSLRHVSLENVYFRNTFDFSIWKQLTVLQVQHNFRGDEFGHSCHERTWLVALSQMPHLEHLLLRWGYCGHREIYPGIPELAPNEDYTHVDVPLPNLRELYLLSNIDDSDIALCIYYHLITPNTCSTTLRLMEIDADHRQLQNDLMLWPKFSRQLKQWHEISIRVGGPNPVVVDECYVPTVFSFRISTRVPSLKNAYLDVEFHASESGQSDDDIEPAEYLEQVMRAGEAMRIKVKELGDSIVTKI